MKYDRILLEHGGGGLLTGELIEQVFLPRLGNQHLMQLTDSALVTIGDQRLCFTTDSYNVTKNRKAIILNNYLFPFCTSLIQKGGPPTEFRLSKQNVQNYFYSTTFQNDFRG